MDLWLLHSIGEPLQWCNTCMQEALNVRKLGFCKPQEKKKFYGDCDCLLCNHSCINEQRGIYPPEVPITLRTRFNIYKKNSPLRKVPTIHEYSWKHWSITINLMIWPIWVIATVVLELARCPAQLFSIWCSPYNGQPLKGAQFVQSIVQWALIRSKEDALLWRCNKRPLQLTEVKQMTDYLSSKSSYTIVRNYFTTSVCIHTKRTY